MNDFRCVVSADLMARAMVAASTEATRYYLNGVAVQPCDEGGALLVATDGHILVAFRDPLGVVEGSGIVKLDPALLKACKGKGAEAAVVAVELVNPTTARAAVLGKFGDKADRRKALRDLAELAGEVRAFQHSGAMIDGVFPDWKRIIPRLEADAPQHPGNFNVKILARIASALAPDTRNAEHVVRVWGNGPADPGLVRANSPFGVDGFGVVMPTRTAASGSAKMPAWADRFAETVPLAEAA